MADDHIIKLITDKNDFAAEIDQRANLGDKLLSKPVTNEREYKELRDEFYSWDEYNRTLLRNSFSTREVYTNYSSSGGGVISLDQSFAEDIEDLKDDIRGKVRRIKSIRGQVPLYRAA